MYLFYSHYSYLGYNTNTAVFSTHNLLQLQAILYVSLHLWQSWWSFTNSYHRRCSTTTEQLMAEFWKQTNGRSWSCAFLSSKQHRLTSCKHASECLEFQPDFSSVPWSFLSPQWRCWSLVFLLFYLFNSPCKLTIKHITDSESPYRPGSSVTV